MHRVLKMKFVLILTCLIGSSASASSVQDIVNRLINLNGRTGQTSSNLENNVNSTCQISVKQEQGTVIVSLERTGLYFTPIAFVNGGSQLISENALIVSTSSKRPGGDACGDFGGAINYKKILTLSDSEVQIQETFRCTLDGFKKYTLISSCKL